MRISERASHRSNTPFPIDVTEFGKVMMVSALQWKNLQLTVYQFVLAKTVEK